MTEDFVLNGREFYFGYQGSHFESSDFLSKFDEIHLTESLLVARDMHMGIPHTHIVVKFTDVVQSTDESILDFQGVRPHIKHLYTLEDYDRAYAYISGEDPIPTVGVLRAEDVMKYMKAISKCKSKAEAIALYASGYDHPLQYANQISLIYDLRIT